MVVPGWYTPAMTYSDWQYITTMVMDGIVTWIQVERTSPWTSMVYRAYLCCTAESSTRVVVTMVRPCP